MISPQLFLRIFVDFFARKLKQNITLARKNMSNPESVYALT